jgi:transcriptional regulator with XRE-family HTH domain
MSGWRETYIAVAISTKDRLPLGEPMTKKAFGDYGQILKALRVEKGLTQEDLAGLLDSSSRYISFVETERSHPSREYLLELVRALDLPPIFTDHVLTSAGYSPSRLRDDFSEEETKKLLKNLKWQTNNFYPYPAVTVDRYWNIQYANQAMYKILKLFNLDVGILDEKDSNQVDLLLSPEKFRPFLDNLLDTEIFYLSRIKAASMRNPDDEKYKELLDRLTSYSSIWTTKSINLLKSDQKLFTYLHFRYDDVELIFQTIRYSMTGKLDSKIDFYWMEGSCPVDEATDSFYREFIINL